MFGGVGTILLVVVMRVLVARQWTAGIGLNPGRRLLLPVVALLIGLAGLRRGGGEVLGSWLPVLVAFAVTVVAGVVRAGTVAWSAVPETGLYPGGRRIRARPVTLVADVGAVLAAAALVLPTVAPVAGLHPAAGAWTLAVAVGDLVASGLLLVRGRSMSAGTSR